MSAGAGRGRLAFSTLGHVLDDGRRLALDAVSRRAGRARAAARDRHRRHLDRLHEGRARELVHDLLRLARVDDAVDDLAEHGFDVAVADDRRRLRHARDRRLLDLLLRVADALRHDRHELIDDARERAARGGRGGGRGGRASRLRMKLKRIHCRQPHALGRDRRERAEHREREHARLPRALAVGRVEDRLLHHTQRVAGQRGHELFGDALGGLAHGRLLVAREREERRQRADEVRVARRADRAEHRLDRRGARLLGQAVDGRDELGEQRRALLLHEFCKVSHRLFVRLGVAAEASHHFLGRRFRVRKGSHCYRLCAVRSREKVSKSEQFFNRWRGTRGWKPGSQKASAGRRRRPRGPRTGGRLT